MEAATIQTLQNGVGQGVEGKGSTNHDIKSSTPYSKQLDKPSVNDAFNLPIIWYASPSGTETVNTIVTPSWIYAGSNGAVYRLDKNKGKILQTQGLSGYGYYPVSLAASSNGNLLVIGTHRYVVRLAPVSLDIIWYFQTDDLGGIPSVMISPDNQRIYAGTAGAVFSLDMNGKKMGRRPSLPAARNRVSRLTRPARSLRSAHRASPPFIPLPISTRSCGARRWTRASGRRRCSLTARLCTSRTAASYG